MRRLLGLARNEPSAELAPQPSLAALPELIDRVRTAARHCGAAASTSGASVSSG